MPTQNKTTPTLVTPDEFLQGVSEKRQAEAKLLMDMLSDISGEKPVMWGPSIIGFGTQHYKSEAGREGDMPVLGFSPRKTALTIYFYEGFDRYGRELAQLGKHKISQSCLYVNKLDDIDLSILRKMVQSSYEVAQQKTPTTQTVQQYIDNVPAQARAHFDELRKIARRELEQTSEVVSYGVIGYKPDPAKRAVAFVSGWKDHVAIYPIPKDEALRTELRPYIHGKGTLWFELDSPLPNSLIERTIRALGK